MKVQVRTFARFKEIFGEDFLMDLEDDMKLDDALVAIGLRSKDIREAILDPAGCIRSYVIIMVNRKRIRASSGENPALRDGDEIAILPPVAGG